MLKRVLLVAGIVVVVLLVAAGIFAVWAMGSAEYPSPTGPHGVGTIQLAVTDTARTEKLGPQPGEPREIGLRIWYPAAPNAEGKRLPTVDGRLAKAFAELYGMPTGDDDGPPAASVIDAPPLTGEQRFPVVLFSHGGFAHRTQNLSTMEALASHGFIVVAIGHSHESILALLPDGRSVPMESKLAGGMNAFAQNDVGQEYVDAVAATQKAGTRAEGVSAARNLGHQMEKLATPLGRTMAELSEIRQGDIAFVVSRLAALDADPDHPLRGRYDLQQVGVSGHSLGAHTAVAACLDQAVAVRACVALDTAYYLLDDDEPVPNLERPVMFVAAESTSLPGGRAVTMERTNRFLHHGATVEPLALVVDGTSHMSFTDMNFLPRYVALAGVLGSIAPPRAATITNDLVVSFFRRHLQGERESWLDAPGERYPEVRSER